MAVTYEAPTLLTACRIRVGHSATHVWYTPHGCQRNLIIFKLGTHWRHIGTPVSQLGHKWKHGRERFIILKAYFGVMILQNIQGKNAKLTLII